MKRPAGDDGEPLRFLHLYAGKHDKLGEALKAEAEAQGLRLEVESLDIETGQDLTDQRLVEELRRKAEQGAFHGAHAGFPCTTFTRLRWRAAPNMPGPVRSREHVYGLPTNSEEQQAEADKGTLMACQALELLSCVEGSGRGGGRKRPVTFENPPETDHPHAASAFLLPEVVAWVERDNIEYADFNNCLYASEDAGERRYKKPQRFVGTLPGLGSLSGTCKCDRSFAHPKVVGREASRDSASYPAAFCRAYAKLMVMAWQGTSGEQGGTDRTEQHPGALQDAEIDAAIQEAEWLGGPGKFGALRESRSIKATRDRENLEAIGGLRRPTASLERVPGLRAVGREISNLFDEFSKQRPEAGTVGEHYGTPGFEIKLVPEWRAALRSHFFAATLSSSRAKPRSR
jgi:hypothetical protein